MCYVAGSQPATVVDYQLVPGHVWYRPEIQRIEFIASPEGDGTVPWDSGRLPNVPMWYVADTAHDMLCAQPVSYTHLRAHETVLDLVCRLLLEIKKQHTYNTIFQRITSIAQKQ